MALHSGLLVIYDPWSTYNLFIQPSTPAMIAFYHIIIIINQKDRMQTLDVGSMAQTLNFEKSNEEERYAIPFNPG